MSRATSHLSSLLLGLVIDRIAFNEPFHCVEAGDQALDLLAGERFLQNFVNPACSILPPLRDCGPALSCECDQLAPGIVEVYLTSNQAFRFQLGNCHAHRLMPNLATLREFGNSERPFARKKVQGVRLCRLGCVCVRPCQTNKTADDLPHPFCKLDAIVSRFTRMFRHLRQYSPRWGCDMPSIRSARHVQEACATVGTIS